MTERMTIGVCPADLEEREISKNTQRDQPLPKGHILTTMGHLNKLTSRGASSFEEELNFAIGVRQLCKRYNILFIADEVRMGSGKTGKFLCSDWMGPENKPNMVVMGKSITGGAYPASYIFGNHEVMDLIGG